LIDRFTVVERHRLQGIRDGTRVWVEKGLESEHAGPIAPERLIPGEADSRLRQVVRAQADGRVVGVLLEERARDRREVIAEWGAVRVVLYADIDDAVERYAMPGEAAVLRLGRRRSGRRRSGCRSLRLRHPGRCQCQSPQRSDTRDAARTAATQIPG